MSIVLESIGLAVIFLVALVMAVMLWVCIPRVIAALALGCVVIFVTIPFGNNHYPIAFTIIVGVVGGLTLVGMVVAVVVGIYIARKDLDSLGR
jgi:hypothetical protein